MKIFSRAEHTPVENSRPADEMALDHGVSAFRSLETVNQDGTIH
jgi:hypothetical protein